MFGVSRESRTPPPGFGLHEVLRLPGSPGPVHRFVHSASAELNAQLLREATTQAGWPRSIFGVEISNVDGFHSAEQSFTPAQPSDWYHALLSDVLIPAMRNLALAEGSTPGKGGLDADGLYREGRIAGWLNVSGARAFNRLHAHPESTWALVYFVASGDETAAAAAPDLDGVASDAECDHRADLLAGALLLTTQPDPASNRRSYLPVCPTPGELWCFPGTMQHAVMPRVLPSSPADLCAALSGRKSSEEAYRVSVAVNVYPESSPHRDTVIGHRPDRGSHKDRDCTNIMTWDAFACGVSGR